MVPIIREVISPTRKQKRTQTTYILRYLFRSPLPPVHLLIRLDLCPNRHLIRYSSRRPKTPTRRNRIRVSGWRQSLLSYYVRTSVDFYSFGNILLFVTDGRLLWDFLQQLLNDSMQRYTNYITWKNRDSGVFKIVDPPGLAKLWGIQKNHLSMNYDKMSRALRYYYRVNILRKVQGERHCYQ